MRSLRPWVKNMLKLILLAVISALVAFQAFVSVNTAKLTEELTITQRVLNQRILELEVTPIVTPTATPEPTLRSVFKPITKPAPTIVPTQ